MEELHALRARIDELDGEMAALFARRMEASAGIAARKRELGLPVRDPAREREVLARNAARIEDPALRPYYTAFQQSLMAASRAYQESLSADRPSALLTLRTKNGLCPVYLRRGSLSQAGALLRPDRRVFVVTDSGVPARYAETVAGQCREAMIRTVPAGEESKSPAVLTALLSDMLAFGLTREDCVAAVGGGVVGDLAGLAAALYLRGVDCYSFPTTVLAMVDSSVGGKTAVNLSGVKNAAGAFSPPRAVLIDPDVLSTLPPRQLANGLSEAVKMSLTHDGALFARFEDPEGPGPIEEIIAAALRVKASVVEEDELERGLRRVLNFGHTLGHGIEAACGGALLHGECVALGMLPMCAPEVRARLLPVLEHLGLPTRASFDLDAALAAIAHDKKTGPDGFVTAVTVPRVGTWAFERMDLSGLRARLEQLQIGSENGGRP